MFLQFLCKNFPIPSFNPQLVVSGQALESPKGGKSGEEVVLKATPVTTKKNENIAKSLGDGVHDVKDAVDKTTEGADAVDKAKGLLGF